LVRACASFDSDWRTQRRQPEEVGATSCGAHPHSEDASAAILTPRMRQHWLQREKSRWPIRLATNLAIMFPRQSPARRGSDKRLSAGGPPHSARGPPHSPSGSAVRRCETTGAKAGEGAGTARAQAAPSANHCQPESLLSRPVSVTHSGLPTLPRRTVAIVSPAARAQTHTAKQAAVHASASTMRTLSSIFGSQPHEGLTNGNLGETSSTKTETATTPTRRANPVAANAEVRG
jgi:hypothetical protein